MNETLLLMAFFVRIEIKQCFYFIVIRGDFYDK